MLLGFLRQDTDVLGRLAVETYVRGLSTGDIEEAFRDSSPDSTRCTRSLTTYTSRFVERDSERECSAHDSGNKENYGLPARHAEGHGEKGAENAP